MASISGTSSSNLSGLYNSANIISGLASGLDTEGMIESLVQSYETKIQGLNQKVTKIEWKQEAYRSIISKMSTFSNNYLSYSSSTNLLSASFFSGATKVVTSGSNSGAVTGTGKSTSEIVLNEVSQLASAARYTTKSKLSTQTKSISTTENFDDSFLNGTMDLGKLNGSLSFKYGDQTISISFDEIKDQIKADTANGISTAQALTEAIDAKLKEKDITIGDKTYTADECIGFSVADDGTITLQDQLSSTGKGNAVYISAASDSIKTALGLDGKDFNDEDNRVTSMSVSGDLVSTDTKRSEYLAGKSLSVTLNGTTKTITLPENITSANDYVTALNTALTDAFGSGKVNAELVDGKLSFSTTSENDQLAISSSAASVLGFDNSTNYLSTSEKLGDLLDFDALVADGTLTANTDGTYDFYLNDTLIGSYDKDTTLSSVLSDINGSDLGIKASYSTLSKSFVFSTKETGSSQKIEMGAGLAQAMFGVSEDGSTDGTYSAGKDAEFVVTVNGEQLSMSRSTNTVDMDGMKLTFSKEFSASYTTDAAGNKVYDTSESVSFTSKADADTIVESITKMVAEYNVMMSEIKSAYSTTPLTQSNGEAYEPLTDDDMADMSDSAIEKYEKKAKTGLLFGDRDLSSLYQKLRFVFSPSGEDGDLLRQMGISTSYSSSDGALTVTVDESKLRSMLETNPDAVTEVFTKTAANDGEDGIMQKIKTQLDAYGATTGATKGILVQKAGSPLSSLSLLDNTYQKQIESLNEQIEDWQDKLSNKVDYYTNQFSRLEVLINQMNSQSSMLSGLSGGY